MDRVCVRERGTPCLQVFLLLTIHPSPLRARWAPFGPSSKAGVKGFHDQFIGMSRPYGVFSVIPFDSSHRSPSSGRCSRSDDSLVHHSPGSGFIFVMATPPSPLWKPCPGRRMASPLQLLPPRSGCTRVFFP